MTTRDRGPTATHRGTGISWPYVVTAVIGGALLALILQNSHAVHFEWLWLDFQASLGVMLLLTAFFTMIATSLAGLLWRVRRRRALDDQADHVDQPDESPPVRPRAG